MARINRHRRIGGRQHLGKSLIADLDFRNAVYKYNGVDTAIASLLASDAALSITFAAGTDITAGSGLTGWAAFTGALLTDILAGATFVLDYTKPTVTNFHMMIDAIDSVSYNTDWKVQDLASQVVDVACCPPASYIETAIAVRPQAGFNRVAFTLSKAVLMASLNGSEPVRVTPPSPAINQAYAHVGLYMYNSGVGHRLRVYRPVIDEHLLQALSRI